METVALVEDGTAKMTRIGMMLSSEMRTKLIKFLKENLDVSRGAMRTCRAYPQR